MALGLKMAGWHVVAAVEWDCQAAMTYAMNLCRYGDLTMHFVEDSDRARMEKAIEASYKSTGNKIFPTAGSGWLASQPDMPGTQHLIIGDVRKLTGRKVLDIIGMDVGELDCVTGGPPCQGFSMAGKRQVADPRNNLVFEFARLVLELRPRTMIMENVPGILDMMTPDGLPVIETLLRVLEDGDFAGMDTLRRTLATQTGAVGLLRAKSRGKGQRASQLESDPEHAESEDIEEQPDMFAEACA